MTSISALPNHTPQAEKLSCCAAKKKTFLLTENPSCCERKSQSTSLEKLIDTICRFAIGAFAFIAAPIPFTSSFGLGLCGGLIYSIIKLSNHQEIFPAGESKPVCAQGYMDFLSGMRFPAPIGTLATAAFIAAHTRCDPSFYAPFCGALIGFWASNQSIHSARNLTAYLFRNFSSGLVAY